MKTRRITLETHLHKIAEYDETVKNLESVFNIQKQKGDCEKKSVNKILL